VDFIPQATADFLDGGPEALIEINGVRDMKAVKAVLVPFFIGHRATTKATLLTALQRGDLHPVTFVKIRKTEKMLIEANPPFKTINIYPAVDSQKPSKLAPKNGEGDY
jgi:hypothetical protein